MIIKYAPNEKDKPVIEHITSVIRLCLEDWYGDKSKLDVQRPEIHSHKNSFILRYPFTTGTGDKKTILAKIRRSPKMRTLSDTIPADIHGNVASEFHSLESVFHARDNRNESFDAIRPLLYMEDYHAILMEEYPSRTLRQILIDRRSSQPGTVRDALLDAAKKTGRWLQHFHHDINTAVMTPYSTSEILYEIQSYAIRLENYSHGRVSADAIVDSFSKKLDGVTIDSILVSQCHADMTCDNVLYSDAGRVCIIDIKQRPAPIYSDLGLLLIHPETFKLQILSGGRYLSESLVSDYRTALLSGFFERGPVDRFLVELFSAIRLLDKWTMYEELISRYKGWKHLFSFVLGPLVSNYFGGVLKRHLAALEPKPIPSGIAMAETR